MSVLSVVAFAFLVAGFCCGELGHGLTGRVIAPALLMLGLMIGARWWKTQR